MKEENNNAIVCITCDVYYLLHYRYFDYIWLPIYDDSLNHKEMYSNGNMSSKLGYSPLVRMPFNPKAYWSGGLLTLQSAISYYAAAAV